MLLVNGFFSTQKYSPASWVLHQPTGAFMFCGLWNQQLGPLYYTFLYKGFEHPWILVSIGVLEPIPCRYQRMTISSVQFSRSVVSDSLRPHESQNTRPPCPSPAPGVHSDSHPSSQWCHPAISSSVVPFSSCPQALPASETLPMTQLFAWGGQVLEFQLRIIPSKEIPGLISFRMD